MTQETGTKDIPDITQILPHRYPFLLVDRILDFDRKKGLIYAKKNLTHNEAFFQGHFPGVPIMPGVLMIEALAQAGAVLVHVNEEEDKVAVLLNIKNARFRNPAKPGDVLYLKGEIIHMSSKGGRIKAVATVNDDSRVAAEAEIGFVLVDKKQI